MKIKKVIGFFKEFKKNWWKMLVGLVIVISLVSGVYAVSFYTKVCESEECFLKEMYGCRRTGFVKEDSISVWQYNVKGLSNGECKINVKLLSVKEGRIDVGDLEGKEMDCFVPRGVVAMPEKDISRCHGLLREEMQELIIDRMHSHIVENLGEIGSELISPI